MSDWKKVKRKFLCENTLGKRYQKISTTIKEVTQIL